MTTLFIDYDFLNKRDGSSTRSRFLLRTLLNKEEVDLLNELEVEFFKVASMDINNYPLLRYLAKFDKPILLSTGMANLGEIEKAVFTEDSVFGFDIPVELPGVSKKVCNPKHAWEDGEAYHKQSQKLARMFQKNYVKYIGEGMTDYSQYGPIIKQ